MIFLFARKDVNFAWWTPSKYSVGSRKIQTISTKCQYRAVTSTGA